ncbi:MAG: hypothetical protein AAFN77_17300 [Planctomycetota bacterium]
MGSLADLLAAQGDDLYHWNNLSLPAVVSADGNTIVGFGINRDGNQEALLASINTSAIPEPTSLLPVRHRADGLAQRRRHQ